jgi:O-antigen/teichoic acid export membrane protein
MFKKLLTHSFLYSVIPQLPKLLLVALIPVFTSYLTEKDYAIYGIIIAYLAFVSVLKDLGFSIVFVNTFYKHTKRWPIIWRMLHGHLVLWNFLYALIFLVVLYIAIPKSELYNYKYISILGLIQLFFFDNTISISNYYYRFSEKIIQVSSISFITGITAILSTYACVVYFHLGYLSWFVSLFITSAINFLLVINTVYFKLKLWPIIQWRKKFITHYLQISLPIIPHNYSSFLLNSSDRIVLDWCKIDKKLIGDYNFAYQFGSFFEIIGSAVGMAVGPYYTKMFTDNSKKSLADECKFTFFMMVNFLCATTLLSLWLKEIFEIMVNNPRLKTTYNLGILIIMGYAYRPMYWSAGIKLSTHNKTNKLWRISAVGGIINLVLNLIFVPKYGVYAACINTLIGLIYIGFAGYFFKSYKALNAPENNHYPKLWIALIFLFTVFVYYLKSTLVLNKVIISLSLFIVYFIYLFKNFKALKNIEI